MKLYKNLIKIIIIISIIILINKIFTITPKDNVTWHEEEYIVCEGDTMWQIAKQNIDSTDDIRQYIDNIEEINNINAGDIKPGQKINVLVKGGE